MLVASRLALVALIAACDAGVPIQPPIQPAVVVARDAAPPSLLGSAPATLGSAFDGLALGQAIDRPSALALLKQRGIDAWPYVRDGHLVSIRLELRGTDIPWPENSNESWFDPASHQHATEVFTERGTFVQIDFELPIDSWFTSVVPVAFVNTTLTEAQEQAGPQTEDNYVDGRARVSWTDSALAGATTATEVTVRDVDQQHSHGIYVSLDGPAEVYAAIASRLVVQLGAAKHNASTDAYTWKRGKIALTRSGEHIELAWER